MKLLKQLFNVTQKCPPATILTSQLYRIAIISWRTNKPVLDENTHISLFSRVFDNLITEGNTLNLTVIALRHVKDDCDLDFIN